MNSPAVFQKQLSFLIQAVESKDVGKINAHSLELLGVYTEVFQELMYQKIKVVDTQEEMVKIMSSMAVSKREQFAMAAMQGLLSSLSPDESSKETYLAEVAFRIADAMLEESKKESKKESTNG